MRVYIGIPMYGGACANFIGSLMKTKSVLQQIGCEVETDINNGCSVITKARNDIVSRFLASGFDVLLFLDSDMEWNPVDAVKLLSCQEDFSAIAYRQKFDDGKFNCADVVGSGEWVKASSVGTGFVAIRRETFLRMIEAYPETEYNDNGVKYALFDFEIHNKQYWGEDFTFCRRWCGIGGEIHVLADATIYHVGDKRYEGNLKQHLEEENG